MSLGWTHYYPFLCICVYILCRLRFWCVYTDPFLTPLRQIGNIIHPVLQIGKLEIERFVRYLPKTP